MVDLIFKSLNIKYFVTDKKGHVIYSEVGDYDPNFILTVLNKGTKEDEIYKYGEKFFQCGKCEDDKHIVYYIQDVSKFVKKYQDLEKDNLTKLYIRSVGMPLIDDYIANSINVGESFSLVMGDIDFFKKVNDTYGHDAGDKVLRQVAMIMLNSFRTRDKFNLNKSNELRRNNQNHPKDVLCRYGGEEFLVLLKNISLEDTLKRVEELRKRIEVETSVTMSFGVMHVTPQLYETKYFTNSVEQTRDNLIKEADNCLYESKRRGRNVISYCTDGEITLYRPGLNEDNELQKKRR